MEYSDTAIVREYVDENREQVIRMIRQEDPFLRALGLAVLLEGGDEADIKMVERELELLKDLGEDYDFY